MSGGRLRVDLNCDMGELPEAIVDGTQEALMKSITSANVACGGHAGNEEMMRATIQQALQAGVAIGAHPGYPDKENFGRLELDVDAEEISEFVYEQVKTLANIAQSCGARVTHVKPHGALYNQAVKDREISRAIADGVKRWGNDVVLVGLAGSLMLNIFREAGFAVAAEAFADRRYEPDGTLRSRKFADALLHDPEDASRQALQIAERGTVIASDGSEVALQAQTICVHGDTQGAVQIAEMIKRNLRGAGVVLSSLTA
jgi:UPF0271 protein